MRIILLTLCVWLCQASTEELKNCQRPSLHNGFLVPRQDAYNHGTKVSYGCNSGLKPVVETWWGELLCGNGEWSHTPHCVSMSDCIAPVVPHATPKPSQVSYPVNSTVTFVCDKGYEFEKKELRQVVCENGEWGPLPTCNRNKNACDAPSHVPNALITQPYRDTFEEGETIEYRCKEGYKFEGKGTSTCEKSKWDHTPKCGGSEGPVISYVGECGDYPPIKNGNFDVDRYSLTFRCYPPYKLRGPKQVMCLSGQWSEVPVCEESDVPSGPGPSHALCGDYPTIEHGDVTEDRDRRVLKVQCAALYKLEGPKEVRCVNRKWSDLPVCKAPCRLDQSKFQYRQREYMQHGEQDWFFCLSSPSYVQVKCDNGRALYRGCGDRDW
ncbi:complement factor H-like isoform X2 [Colossoma macropomum]|uniref:complement factor H-like isoform X2 n=1 Tax=Colossoma macropomum TaxID=42526 RepID=UPI001864352F|nr:complement factor H-like isoform X2 [Colossoma macropomum]